jgi:hypothetical protein
MTHDLLKNHWGRIREDCPRYWGKLSAADLDRIDGQYERFVSALRARYGFSRLKAEDELEQFLFQYGDEPARLGGAQAGAEVLA